MTESESFLGKTLEIQTKRDRLAWLLFLLLFASAAYRSYVLKPIGIDGYALYLPGVSFLPPFFLLSISSRRTALSFCRLILAVALTFGWLLPLRHHSNEDGTARLVSLNIQSESTDLSHAIGQILEHEPDFICLQEIWHRSELEVAQKALKDYQVLGAASDDYKRRKFNEGTFVAIRNDWKVERASLKEESALVTAHRTDLTLTIVSVHSPRSQSFSPTGLSQTVREQTSKAEELESELASISDAIVIAGDFNAPECGPAFKILAPRFHSAFLEAGTGLGLSFPSGFPLARIDHALGTRQVVFSSFQTRNFGSDHLGLIVDFNISR